MSVQKLVCRDYKCAWCGLNSEALRAPDPFNPGRELMACPKCREVGTLVQACEWEGCRRAASGGLPTGDGYRWFCSEHYGQAGDSH